MDSLLKESVRHVKKRIVLKALEEAFASGLLVPDATMEGNHHKFVVSTEELRQLLRAILAFRFPTLIHSINVPPPGAGTNSVVCAVNEAMMREVAMKNRAVLKRGNAQVGLLGYRVVQDLSTMEAICQRLSLIEGSHAAESGSQAIVLQKKRRIDEEHDVLRQMAALPGMDPASLSDEALGAAMAATSSHLDFLNSYRNGPIHAKCAICLSRSKDMAVLIPCGMMCVCTSCAEQTYIQKEGDPNPGQAVPGRQCPICSRPIIDIIPRVFAS